MKQEALNVSRMFIWGDKFECEWLFAQCFLLRTDSNFFAPSLILMNSFQFILNLCVDIWFWVDNPEITHWLLHSKCSDRNMYVEEKVTQIDGTIGRCQTCFFPRLSDL